MTNAKHTVFVVTITSATDYGHEQTSVAKIFTNESDAKQYVQDKKAKHQRGFNNPDYDIEEYEVE